MLSEVLRVVQGEGWFDTGNAFEKTIYLSQGSAQCVLLSRGGRPDTFVKFTTIASFASEALQCRLSSERFPGLVPRFVGYAQRQSLEVLTTRAVDFRPLDARALSGGRGRRAVCAGLERVFRRMLELGPHPDGDQDGHAWFPRMCAYYEGHELQAVAAPALERLNAALSELPALAQHGDLVLNNLGLGPGRQLVIFDWEDYGAVRLPGLDLFTLENSVQQELQRDAAPAAGRLPRVVLDVVRLCKALALSPRLYDELSLGYALAFRYLKRNYSPEVRARLDRVILATAARQDAGRIAC